MILDPERLDLLSSYLSGHCLPVILVRPSFSKHVSGSRVKEWSKVLDSYTGSNTAWEKEPQILPDDNATVSRDCCLFQSPNILSKINETDLLHVWYDRATQGRTLHAAWFSGKYV